MRSKQKNFSFFLADKLCFLDQKEKKSWNMFNFFFWTATTTFISTNQNTNIFFFYPMRTFTLYNGRNIIIYRLSTKKSAFLQTENVKKHNFFIFIQTEQCFNF